jgi:hypothetical protein
MIANEGEVYFALFGDEFDPDEVTRAVGVQPTSTRRKGNPTPKRTAWKVSTGKIASETIDVYEMSSLVVSRLSDKADEIVAVKERLGLEAVLQVVIYLSNDESISTPALGFDHNVIAFLNSVGASIDIDTYK